MRRTIATAVVSIAPLLVPWLLGHGFRQAHPGSIAAVSLLATALVLVFDKKPRAERLLLFVMSFLFWPAALVAAVRGLVGLDRIELVAAAGFVVAIAATGRMLLVHKMPHQHGSGSLLDRAFPDIAGIARAELALLWFGLFRWRRQQSDAPADAVRFPGTATGIELAMCLLTAAGFAIETPLLHLLLVHISTPIVAWSCTALHVLFGLYLVGYAKSLAFRPTLLFPDRLEIRLGVVARRVVARGTIETLSAHDGHSRNDGQRLFGLDEPNLRLQTLDGSILFRVDEPKKLMRALSAA